MQRQSVLTFPPDLFFMKDSCCFISFRIFCVLGFMSWSNFLFSIIVTSFCSIVLVASATLQIIYIIKNRPGLQILISALPPIIVLLACFLLFPILFLQKEKHEWLLTKMITNLCKKKSEELTRINQHSQHLAKMIIRFTTWVSHSAIIVMIMTPYFTRLRDVFDPTNETRPMVLLFYAEYFVDQQYYFHVLHLYQCFGCLIVVTVVCSLLNVTVIFLLHISAMFKEVGYEFKSLDPQKIYKKHGSDRKKLLEQSIINCLTKHQTTLEMAMIANDCGDLVLILILAVTFSAFTLSMVQVTNPKLIDIKAVLFTGGQIGQFVILSILGQYIMDTSASLSEKVYDARWFDYPPHLQKLFSLIILRANDPFTINCKNVYVLSLKNLGGVLQTAMSYCMVIRQFQ